MSPRLEGAYSIPRQGLDVLPTLTLHALLQVTSTARRVHCVRDSFTGPRAMTSSARRGTLHSPAAPASRQRVVGSAASNQIQHTVGTYETLRPGRDRLAVSHPTNEETVMARPSKGKRVGVTAKIPLADFEKMDRFSQITGVTKNDFVADLITKGLAEIDIDELEGQDQLPMSA